MNLPFETQKVCGMLLRRIDLKLLPLKSLLNLLYLKNTVIFSLGHDQNILPVRPVLGILKWSGVTLNVKKFVFLAEKIDYFGLVIKPGGLDIS